MGHRLRASQGVSGRYEARQIFSARAFPANRRSHEVLIYGRDCGRDCDGRIGRSNQRKAAQPEPASRVGRNRDKGRAREENFRGRRQGSVFSVRCCETRKPAAARLEIEKHSARDRLVKSAGGTIPSHCQSKRSFESINPDGGELRF